MNDAIVHFVIGSSPIITVFPFFILYNAHNRLSEEDKENCKISFNTLCMVIPFLYGTVFAVLYAALSAIIPRKIKNIYSRFIICGALSAMIISLIMDHILHIHTDWLNIENTNMYHVCTFIFYLILYYTVGQWLRSQILYGPTPKSAPSSPSLKPLAPQSAVGKIHSPSVNSASAAKFESLKQKVNK